MVTNSKSNSRCFFLQSVSDSFRNAARFVGLVEGEGEGQYFKELGGGEEFVAVRKRSVDYFSKTV